MKSLLIRNLSEDVMNELKQLAAASHRSVQEYVRAMIEREVRLAKPSPVEVARRWRSELAKRSLGDTVTEVQGDRER